jgi:ketosteroid isomerase-like protein
MKRKGFLIILLLMFSLVVLTGCQPAGPDTNRSAATATPETVDTAAIEAELLRIENDWPRVMREKDAAAVRRVEADDVVIIYPDGSVGNKEQDVKDVESGAFTAESMEIVDLKVNVLDKDAAVVSGRTIVRNGKFKMPSGQTIDISGEYRFVDTFARRNGEWKLVAGAGVPVRQVSTTASPSPTASPTAKASPTVRPSPSPRASPAVSPTSTP